MTDDEIIELEMIACQLAIGCIEANGWRQRDHGRWSKAPRERRPDPLPIAGEMARRYVNERIKVTPEVAALLCKTDPISAGDTLVDGLCPDVPSIVIHRRGDGDRSQS